MAQLVAIPFEFPRVQLMFKIEKSAVALVPFISQYRNQGLTQLDLISN